MPKKEMDPILVKSGMVEVTEAEMARYCRDELRRRFLESLERGKAMGDLLQRSREDGS